MSTNMEIAKRIVKIIISPDSVIGFVHGMLSVPQDLGYLALIRILVSCASQKELEWQVPLNTES